MRPAALWLFQCKNNFRGFGVLGKQHWTGGTWTPPFPIYKNEQGVVYKQPNWTTRVVLFDAQGSASRASGGRTWGDVDEVKGYCDPDNREWEDEDQPVRLDNSPSTNYPLSDDQYEADDERVGRRSACVTCRAPFSVREARLRMLSGRASELGFGNKAVGSA